MVTYLAAIPFAGAVIYSSIARFYEKAPTSRGFDIHAIYKEQAIIHALFCAPIWPIGLLIVLWKYR